MRHLDKRGTYGSMRARYRRLRARERGVEADRKALPEVVEGWRFAQRAARLSMEGQARLLAEAERIEADARGIRRVAALFFAVNVVLALLLARAAL